MSTWLERYRMACRHVVVGRQVIGRQQAIIERQRACGADTIKSEHLLAMFEHSQTIFEDDLDRIYADRPRVDSEGRRERGIGSA
jgi:hypothetical protein